MALCKVKDFFDSDSNVSMIKRSALTKDIITKLLGGIKLVRTLAGHPNMQKVITMQNLRLPEFDKNRRINQQKNLVFYKVGRSGARISKLPTGETGIRKTTRKQWG